MFKFNLNNSLLSKPGFTVLILGMIIIFFALLIEVTLAEKVIIFIIGLIMCFAGSFYFAYKNKIEEMSRNKEFN